MRRLQGPVSGLEHRRHDLGRGRSGRSPSAVHIYCFDVAGERVELRHGAALPLNEGDEVVAVCGGRRCPQRIYAWANRTWGATLVEPPGIAAAMRGWLPAIPAVALLALALGLSATGAGAVPLAIAGLSGLSGLALALLALRGFIEYARYRRAAALLG